MSLRYHFPHRRLDHVRSEPSAPLILRVGPLGCLALDLANVLLPNVTRLAGLVEEEAEHVGRGLVVGDGPPLEEHEATLHVLVREDEREADDEAGLRVASAG